MALHKLKVTKETTVVDLYCCRLVNSIHANKVALCQHFSKAYDMLLE